MKLTVKIIAAGLALLLAALVSSLVAMIPSSQRVVEGGAVIEARGEPASALIASLLGNVSGGVEYVNVTITNLEPHNITVIYVVHRGGKLFSQRLTLKPFERVTVQAQSLLDTVIVEPGQNASRVDVQVKASVVERKLLGLGIVGLALFIAGSVLVTVGIALRLSGLEVE